MTGWNLPPGCTSADIERAMGGDAICECCGNEGSDCICPECPVCSDYGNPACYDKHGEHFHGLRYNKRQRHNQSIAKIEHYKELIGDEQQYQAWLETQPEDWKDDK